MEFEVSTIDELKDSAIQYLQSTYNDMVELQNQRAIAFDAYLCKPDGNEVKGRSKFVTSDLSDVVESIMPSLMRTFYGNKTVVSINPVGIEDEVASKLMEQKVNFDFTSGINGYRVMDTWFRDSLYQKIGVVKYYWLEEEIYKSKEYDDLTEPEYMNLLQQVDAGKFVIDKEEVETSQEAEFDEFGGMVRPAEVRYSVEGRKVTKISKPVVENVPPEEFGFDVKSRSLDKCYHKKRVHKSELLKYDVKDADLSAEYDNFLKDPMYLKRFEDLGGIRFFCDENDHDYVYIYECYLDYYDKKGNKTPMVLLILGNKVLKCEENKYGRPPFCVITPINVPHRLIGRDFADLVRPIQELHTYYTRYINDNLAYQNNGMRVVNPFRLQMDDVLNENNPGGFWRTKYDVDPSRCVLPITPTPLSPEVYALIDKMDVMRQERTGVTKYNNGLDSKSLNRTASGISQIMGAAQQRIELIARNYAETGVRDLFQALVDMNIDFMDTEVNLKINNEWQLITPDAIDGRFDITVDVGASMGTAEIQVNQMMQMLNTYQMLKQTGVPIPNKYELEVVREVWSRWGYKNVDQYAPNMEGLAQDLVEQQKMMMVVQQAVAPMMPQMPPQGMPPQGGQPPMPPQNGMMQ